MTPLPPINSRSLSGYRALSIGCEAVGPQHINLKKVISVANGGLKEFFFSPDDIY